MRDTYHVYSCLHYKILHGKYRNNMSTSSGCSFPNSTVTSSQTKTVLAVVPATVMDTLCLSINFALVSKYEIVAIKHLL